MHLYIYDSGSRASLSGGRVVVRSDEGGETSHPIETIDSIVVFGRPAMTTHLVVELLMRSIQVHLFTTDGHYRGRISGPGATYAPRLRAQVHRSEDPAFALAVSRRLVCAKVCSQIALLTAHAGAADLSAQLDAMRHSLNWLRRVGTLAEISGFEGNAAKAYFAALAMLVPDEFAFAGRSTRPPRDAFNSMISLGYSLLYKNIVGGIERNGLNPYIAFLHQDSRNHAALASDLMEPWRAPIVDDTVLRLLKEGEVGESEFVRDETTGSVYGTRSATRALSRAFGNRIARTVPYLSDDTRRYTFQYALDLQVQSLVRAIERDDPALLADLQLSVAEPSVVVR